MGSFVLADGMCVPLLQSYGLDKGMPNVTPWTWAKTGSFFAHMGVQGAGKTLDKLGEMGV